MIYEMICNHCNVESEVMMSLADFEKGKAKCVTCDAELTRHFRTAPEFNIPGHCTHDGITKISGSCASKGKKEQLAIPMQVENSDGSITRLGKPGDIEV